MAVFTQNSIFFMRYDSLAGNAKGKTEATVLLSNAYALNIVTADRAPERMPLNEAGFDIKILRTPMLLFNGTAQLVATPIHPIEEIPYDYQATGITLEKIVNILNRLSQEPRINDFSFNDILETNVIDNAAYYPTQIDITPVHVISREALDVDALIHMQKTGKLRTAMDYSSPVLQINRGIPPPLPQAA
ncbi:MAG: hypothetical protein ACPGRX_05800 [Bdellovibrionales bacterium]